VRGRAEAGASGGASPLGGGARVTSIWPGDGGRFQGGWRPVWSSKGWGTRGVFIGENYGVQSKDSSNQILPVLILYLKVWLGFAKGENLGLVPIQDKSSFFDSLPRFHAQKSPWWAWLAARQSEPFGHGATTTRLGAACTTSSTRGWVMVGSSWATQGRFKKGLLFSVFDSNLNLFEFKQNLSKSRTTTLNQFKVKCGRHEMRQTRL
jgi:hypothetical protein